MQTIPLPKYQVSVIKKLISEQPVGDHAVRILVLYGSLREGSFSRKLAE